MMKEELEDQFCIKCGAILDRKYVDMRYDLYLGNKKFNIIWRCPKKRWWNSHTKFKSDEDGNTYSFEI